MAKTAVVALGGNALTREGQEGTHEQLAANAMAMARSVSSLLRDHWRVVLVHGNGPQVGNLAIQQEEGTDVVPEQPLFSLGAMTQGQLGSLFALALRKVLGSRAPEIVPLVTHSEVDPADPAFSHPTKPIGPFLTPEEAQAFAAERGWAVREDAGRGWRRVVPSPEPVRILESGAIRALLDAGVVVIAAGGGGIPVTPTATGHQGVDAVIDKDYAAERLATSLGADALVLVTSVEAVLLDYGTPQQRAMLEMSVDDAEAHLSDGQFPEGSMGPKVRAAVRFLRHGGEVA
ncbi:MAG: carbamate kinase, partial [Acidimicrobiia bacterium]